MAITAPRTVATDELLAEQDHIVLVADLDADPQLVELARDGLERIVPVTVRGPLAAPGARATALAGWGRLRVPA